MAVRTITVPVKDLESATALYRTLLGVDPYMESPYYVGFRPDDSPEIGLDPHGDVSVGPITYYRVADIESAVAELADQGATVEQKPVDVGGGGLRALLRDGDGNVIGLFQGA
jgi:predicted enzyme related to lactoylglutathione lyase